jgi:hypothetical protein
MLGAWLLSGGKRRGAGERFWLQVIAAQRQYAEISTVEPEGEGRVIDRSRIDGISANRQTAFEQYSQALKQLSDFALHRSTE